MPELPEVETVRRGLAEAVTGRRIASAAVLHPRAVRRQLGGATAFCDALAGAAIASVERRGKFLWLRLLDAPHPVLVAHLAMSGQFRTAATGELGFGPHERVRVRFTDGAVLSFVDQRTFGWLLVDDAPTGLPSVVAHIAADPFDPSYDIASAGARLRSRRTGIKRGLLDQTVVSGIGNIYADETLWRCRLHPSRATDSLSAKEACSVLQTASEVMSEALEAGGTSFDPLYVNVNGDSGWFSRDLAVYGRAGQPCRRCGRPILREAFANRSSHRCPRCQRLPVRRR